MEKYVLFVLSFLVVMTFRDWNLKFIVRISHSNKQIVLEFEIETWWRWKKKPAQIICVNKANDSLRLNRAVANGWQSKCLSGIWIDGS